MRKTIVGRKKIKNDKDKIRRKLKQIKTKSKCAICGEADIACLEFHHKDSTIKNGELNSMISKFTYEEIMKELENCTVLCSNCHRKLHYRGRENETGRMV